MTAHQPGTPARINEELAAANEQFDSKSAVQVSLWPAWDPSCECMDCGDTGIKPETNRPAGVR